MCFKKKAPPKETQKTQQQQQQLSAEETSAAVAAEKEQVIADVREQKTEAIRAEAPLSEKEIKMGKRGGTGRRTLLVSGAGGAGYLSRFPQASSRLWG